MSETIIEIMTEHGTYQVREFRVDETFPASIRVVGLNGRLPFMDVDLEDLESRNTFAAAAHVPPDDLLVVRDRLAEDLDGRLLTELQSYLKLRVGQPIKRGETYDLPAPEGKLIKLGSAQDVFDPRKVEAAVHMETGHTIPHYTRKAWRPAVELIGRLAVEESTTSEEEETLMWIDAYENRESWGSMQRQPGHRTMIVQGDVMELTLKERFEFIHLDLFRDLAGDRIWLRPASLLQHVTVALGQRITFRQQALRLRRVGFQPETLTVAGSSDERIKQRFWVGRTELRGER